MRTDSSQMPPSDHSEQIHLQKERRVSSLAGGGTEARSKGCFRGSAAQRRHTHRLQGSLPFGRRGSAMLINTLSQLEHKHVFSMKYILNYISVLVSEGYGSKGPQTGWLTAQNAFPRSPGGWKCRSSWPGRTHTLGRILSLCFSASRGSRLSLASSGITVSASVVAWTSLLCLSVFPPLLIRTPAILD